MDIRLALTGFGNVGRGVAELIRDYGDDYESRFGVRLILTGVADRGGAVTGDSLDPASLLTAKEEHGTVAALPRGQADLQGSAFLEAAHAQVLLEASSTNFEDAEPGWGYVREAFGRGMDVVLASKGALVLYYADLFRQAQEHGRLVRFAGTVGAPLPVLELADRVLIGGKVTAVEGILNATTNQILTSMAEGATYEEGVRDAQKMGVAETDPTLDVDGWDAAAKALIVANSVLGGRLRLEDVSREGIRGVTREDLEAAKREGSTIKLIARASRDGDQVRAEVRPERRPLNDVLGALSGTGMGVVFHAEPLGRMTSTVEAATSGGVVTALTMLRDVVNLARERGWTIPQS